MPNIITLVVVVACISVILVASSVAQIFLWFPAHLRGMTATAQEAVIYADAWAQDIPALLREMRSPYPNEFDLCFKWQSSGTRFVI